MQPQINMIIVCSIFSKYIQPTIATTTFISLKRRITGQSMVLLVVILTNQQLREFSLCNNVHCLRAMQESSACMNLHSLKARCTARAIASVGQRAFTRAISCTTRLEWIVRIQCSLSETSQVAWTRAHQQKTSAVQLQSVL